MGVSFTVETDAVRQKARMLEGLADEYDGMRSRLLNTATSMGAAYESADNRVYVARITEFCEQMKEVSHRLRNAANVLNTQSSGYDRTESENAAQANRLP